MRKGRRWAYGQLSTGTRGRPEAWWWDAWRLFERVGGVCPSEADALAAIDHFLSSSTSYTLQPKAVARG